MFEKPKEVRFLDRVTIHEIPAREGTVKNRSELFQIPRLSQPDYSIDSIDTIITERSTNPGDGINGDSEVSDTTDVSFESVPEYTDVASTESIPSRTDSDNDNHSNYRGSRYDLRPETHHRRDDDGVSDIRSESENSDNHSDYRGNRYQLRPRSNHRRDDEDDIEIRTESDNNDNQSDYRGSRYQLRPRSHHRRYDDETTESLFVLMGEPETYREAIESLDSKKWIEAMKCEIQSMIKNQTWDLVKLPPGRKVVDCKWTYKIKSGDHGQPERYKARLCEGFHSNLRNRFR
jgi:hypothetical protein